MQCNACAQEALLHNQAPHLPVAGADAGAHVSRRFGDLLGLDLLRGHLLLGQALLALAERGRAAKGRGAVGEGEGISGCGETQGMRRGCC